MVWIFCLSLIKGFFNVLACSFCPFPIISSHSDGWKYLTQHLVKKIFSFHLFEALKIEVISNNKWMASMLVSSSQDYVKTWPATWRLTTCLTIWPQVNGKRSSLLWVEQNHCLCELCGIYLHQDILFPFQQIIFYIATSTINHSVFPWRYEDDAAIKMNVDSLNISLCWWIKVIEKSETNQ